MSSKTKIIVLHLKELIYTAIFAVLGILLIILLIFMFLPKDEADGGLMEATAYIPGVYTSTITLNNSAVDVEVTVDSDNINSIRLVNLDEAVSAMYPLIEPSFQDIISQIYQNQSLEGITYATDSRFTSMVIVNAIESALQKASSAPVSGNQITE